MATLNKKGIAQSLLTPRIAFCSRKAISPIIATILIMMMVVAAAGGMFFWFTRIQGQQQGSVESFQGKLLKNTATQASILKANYNDTNQNLDLFIQNIGNNPISLDNGSSYPTTTWIVFDSNQRSICSTNWGGYAVSNVTCNLGCGTDISIGQIRRVTVDLTNGSCTLRSQPNGSKISFTIDFSGITTSGGSFNK